MRIDVTARVACVGLGLLVPTVGGAHDFATRTAAHRLQVVVDLDRIGVDYTVEAPFGAALPPTVGGRALDVETPDEVTSGLLLELDGKAVPLRADPDQRPRVRATSHTEAIRVWLLADAPASDEATIQVSNANYPDLAPEFWTDVWVGSQVDVLDSDLLPDGSDGIDLGGRWRTDDAARRTTVHARFRRGPLEDAWARLGGVDGQVRPLADAAPETFRTFWTRNTLRPAQFAGLAALATALGLVRGDGPEGPLRTRLFRGTVAAIPVLLLLALPAALHPALELVGGVIALGVGAYAVRGGPAVLVPLGGLLALTSIAQKPGYGALLAVIALAALATPGFRSAIRLPIGLAVLTGLIAVVRGVAVLW